MIYLSNVYMQVSHIEPFVLLWVWEFMTVDLQETASTRLSLSITKMRVFFIFFLDRIFGW